MRWAPVMKRSTVFSAVLVATCLFVGAMLKVEAARYSADRGLVRSGAAAAQAADDCGPTGYWAAWAAAAAAD